MNCENLCQIVKPKKSVVEKWKLDRNKIDCNTGLYYDNFLSYR